MTGVSWGPDRIDLFAVAAESSYLLHKYFNPGGHDFETIEPKSSAPIEILGGITVATFGTNVLFVFFSLHGYAYCGNLLESAAELLVIPLY